MSRIPTRTVAVGATCAVAALGAGSLLSAGAATPAKPAAAQAVKPGQAKGEHARHGGAVARAVHLEATVPTKDGFAAVTIDRGRLVEADGSTLTLRQGTRRTSRTVRVDVPSGAEVRRERAAAQLSDLRAGDRVAVVTGLPRGAVVRAAVPRRTR